MRESQRAILNYYLGSTVAAYIHYDELLDVQYDSLSAQELFYYGLMADMVNMEAEIISTDSIEQITNKIEKRFVGNGRFHQ